MQGFTRSRLGASAILNTSAAWGGLAIALSLGLPGVAFAQQEATPKGGPTSVGSDQAVEEAASDEGVAKNDIVVTGTLVRGIAPPGASQIGRAHV